LRGELHLQHQFSQSIYHNGFEINETKKNKINPESNTHLMGEYNNENMLDNNSEKKIKKKKIKIIIIKKIKLKKKKINEK